MRVGIESMRLLVTRPDADAARTSAVLRARGHEVRHTALLRIEAVAADIGAGPWTAMLMTSGNAVRAVTAHPGLRELRELPVFVVGARSAEAARQIGFAAVFSADGNAADLAAMVARRLGGVPARVLYLCGADRSFDLAGALRGVGLDVCSVEIYRAVAAQDFAADITALLRAGEIDGVLHFSRRSAQIYLACAARADAVAAALRPTHYCISAQAAAPLVDAGAATVRVAPRPDEDALIALVGRA